MDLYERLIVAADYDPKVLGSSENCLKAFQELVSNLAGTGVVIKVNSLLRRYGYDIISEINQHGLRCMADLKLDDIPKTLELDGHFLSEFKPDILTVKCSAGISGMATLKDALPDCEVVGVTVLTSFTKEDCSKVYGEEDIETMVIELFNLAQDAGLDGVVCSPKEVVFLSQYKTDLKFLTPGIRPSWSIVDGDDQNINRVTTPRDAMINGSTRIVIGRPITKHDNPKNAVGLTLKEIEEALEELNA